MKYSPITALALATTILAASCQRENDMVCRDEGMTISAVSEGIGADSKAEVAYKYDILWKEGDMICVKNSEKSSLFDLVDGIGSTSGIFSSFSSISGEVEAFYPADIAELVWPAEQQNGQAPPMYCKKNLSSTMGQTFNFTSLGSVLQLVFSTVSIDITLGSIEVSADEAMSGAFTVADGKAVITQPEEGDKPGITLDLGKDGEKIGMEAKKFNIVIPSGTYNNLTISFSATNGNKYQIRAKKALTIDHNTVYSLSTSGSFGGSSKEVETGAATQVSCRNARLAGKAYPVSPTEGSLTLGVLYSTSPEVPEFSATRMEARYFDSEYNFTVETGILKPETTYYYRSYISQAGTTLYGDIKSFKTFAVSSMIQTLDVTDINPKGAVLNAALNLSGCVFDNVEYGFEVTPEGEDTFTVKPDNQSPAEKKFSVKVDSLQQDKQYSVAAYAMLDGLIYKGESKNFTTTPIRVSIAVDSSNVGHKVATVSGKLTVESKGSFTKSAALYYSATASTLEELKSSGKEVGLTLGDSDVFSKDLSMLLPGTKYNYVVVATVDQFEFDSGVKSFNTLPLEWTVTADTSVVSYHSAYLSGILKIESKDDFKRSAAVYYSTTESTVEGLKSSGTRSLLRLEYDGSFNTALSYLVSNTSYNYVVVAKADDFEINTGVKSFSTLQIKASLSAQSSNVKCKTATVSGKLKIESKGTFTKSATLYYSTKANTLEDLKSNGMKLALTLGSDGSFSTDLSSLAHDTQYYYAVTAEVDDIVLNTEVKSFNTLPLVASVTTDDAKTKCTSAIITGQLTVSSDEEFNKSAVMYYSETATSASQLKQSGKKVQVTLASDSSFSQEIKYLPYYSACYYLVVAKVDDMEIESLVGRFVTLNYQVPQMVDLGLSVKWASFNVGAVSPEDFGGFYQWAGLNDVADPSISLDLDNCPYHKPGTDARSGWTKYIPSNFSSYWAGSGGPDNRTTIGLEDDIARQKLGSGWRIPTYAEWGELHDLGKCDWTWTEINGVGGYKVTSKIPGYTNNWIFLPAAGYRSGNGHYEEGTQGHYGSSTLESQYSPFASCHLFFYSSYVIDAYPGRPTGMTIRAVCK